MYAERVLAQAAGAGYEKWTEDRGQAAVAEWGGERDARLIGRKGSTYLAPNLKTTLNVVKSESKFPLDNKLVLKLF